MNGYKIACIFSLVATLIVAGSALLQESVFAFFFMTLGICVILSLIVSKGAALFLMALALTILFVRHLYPVVDIKDEPRCLIAIAVMLAVGRFGCVLGGCCQAQSFAERQSSYDLQYLFFDRIKYVKPTVMAEFFLQCFLVIFMQESGFDAYTTFGIGNGAILLLSHIWREKPRLLLTHFRNISIAPIGAFLLACTSKSLDRVKGRKIIDKNTVQQAAAVSGVGIVVATVYQYLKMCALPTQNGLMMV